MIGCSDFARDNAVLAGFTALVYLLPYAVSLPVLSLTGVTIPAHAYDFAQWTGVLLPATVTVYRYASSRQRVATVVPLR